MSWHDRGYGDDATGGMGRPGGDWRGDAPDLREPDDVVVALRARAFEIAVRVHVVFLLYIVVALAKTLFPAHQGASRLGDFKLVALDLGCLFGLVLLHEFGHCLACRRVGGEASEILMWPLGGLAYCRPPQLWQAHFVTAAGGPMVNVVIGVVLAPTLGLLTGAWWTVAIPNPLDLAYPPLGVLQVPGLPLWAMHGLFALNSMNFVLLLFNLLPIFPLDGGRLLQALLWPRFGYSRSMRLAVYAGYLGAIALGIAGWVTESWMLVAIAIFGGVTCYLTVKQLDWTDAVMGGGDSLYAASLWGADDDEAEEEHEVVHSTRSAPAPGEADENDDTEALDRILAKIGEHGMGSLSSREKRVLKQATDRRRRDET